MLPYVLGAIGALWLIAAIWIDRRYNVEGD